MLVKITFTTRMSDTLHRFRFKGDTELGELWPEEMVQGGESYRLRWDMVPDHVREDLEDVVDLELVER